MPPTSLSPDRAAEAIERRLLELYILGRARSRLAGFDRLRSEVLAYAGLDPQRPANDLAYELARAERAAGGYAGAWRDSVLDAIEAERSSPYVWATRDQAWRIEMGATTESAEAFNIERERTLRGIRADLVKVWDAELDKRTCQTCFGAHGTVVEIAEPFPQGIPGGVHPRCRCIEQILPRHLA